MDRDITLNFIPVEEQEFKFRVYTKPVEGQEANPDRESLRRYGLRETEGAGPEFYWVSLTARDEFAERIVSCQNSWELTKWWLICRVKEILEQSSKALDVQWYGRSFGNIIDARYREHPEGWESMAIEPYFLQFIGKFGLRLNFKFRVREDQEFNVQVQKLSKSLDAQGMSNRNFYRDKYRAINGFLDTFLRPLFPLSTGLEQVITLESKWCSCTGSTLAVKQYEFAKNKMSASQYQGVKNSGPYILPEKQPTYVFVFKDAHRSEARHLYRCLQGTVYSQQFPGMDKMFGVKIDTENTEYVVLQDYSRESLLGALEHIKGLGVENPVPIVLIEDPEQDYYLQKSLFVHESIPTQDVRVETLRSDRVLKWAIAGIGLQLFCKSGGVPWRVKVEDDDCLIVGVSQTHIRNEGGVSRYYAYAILTDSSGQFQEIEQLADATSREESLMLMRKQLEAILKKSGEKYGRVVVHATYTMRRDEMRLLRESVSAVEAELHDTDFAVIKLNERPEFFGFDMAHGSLVPYESTYFKLGRGDYLLWFEGTQFGNPHISQRVPGPTHVKFIYQSKDFNETDEYFLQELLNLSGANWRGFNAKASPVSTFYCSLVGRFIGEFCERDLPMPTVEDLTPWFL
jgi:hypothetical protein